jgi:hypothetical protein
MAVVVEGEVGVSVEVAAIMIARNYFENAKRC